MTQPSRNPGRGWTGGESLCLAAPAKLNLRLKIIGRRADGYHELESLMVKLSLGDQVTITPGGEGLRLHVRGADLAGDETNLAHRAATAFYTALGRAPQAEILLEKRVPLGAGLGGGSSDAAAVLGGLNRLHGLPLSQRRLFELGAALGADVNFFLDPAPAAVVRGIGEKVEPLPAFPCFWYVVINPGWPLSTAWVYKNYKLQLTTKGKNHIYSNVEKDGAGVCALLENDLETVVLPRYPELSTLKKQLMASGAAGSLMSGSGASVFGVFPNENTAMKAYARLAAQLADGEKTRVFLAAGL